MRSRHVLGALLAIAVAFPVGAVRAEGPAQKDYRDEFFVQVTLGEPNVEDGIRLVDGLPDGLTEPMTGDPGRKSLTNTVGTERYFYFDVHDTYVRGGINSVMITVAYRDRGLTPFYLEYDAYDPDRPDSKADGVTKKRVTVTNRANSEVWNTAYITLDDARFGNNQPGGGDFRLVSSDELIISNVSVRLLTHEEPKPPIRVVIDGKPITFDVVPYIDPRTGRTLVPMRAIFNALGVSDGDISWDGAARTVTARRGQTTIVLTIDSDVAHVNFVPVRLDQPAVIRADRTLVPIRFVSEQFGLKVEWNEASRQITLTSPAQIRP